jgi:hypothetical protein
MLPGMSTGCPGNANPRGDDLPVGEGEVRRGGHGGEVALPFRRLHRRAGELAVGEVDAVARHDLHHVPNEVGGDLVAEAARAGVDLHDDLIAGQAEARGFLLVVQRLDHVDLDEVVAGADGAELVVAALLRAGGDLVGIGAVDAAA